MSSTASTPARICPICGKDISALWARALTCRNTNCRKQDYRERKKLEKLAAATPRPQHTKCRECDRLWKSDLDPTEHRCPCGGMIEIGDGDRVVNHKLERAVKLPAPTGEVSPDPLSGVDREIIAWIKENGHSSWRPPRPPVDFRVTTPPECWSRSCRQPRAGRSAFCADHTQLDDVKSDAQNDTAAENNVVSIWSLPRDLPDYTVAGLLGLPMPAEIAVAP
jgi:hypothetical protein